MDPVIHQSLGVLCKTVQQVQLLGVANLVWSFTTLSFREQPILDAVAARQVKLRMSAFGVQGPYSLNVEG